MEGYVKIVVSYSTERLLDGSFIEYPSSTHKVVICDGCENCRHSWAVDVALSSGDWVQCPNCKVKQRVYF